MFVIRRKEGECIMIGDDVEVHVLEIANNRVKLGFVAPAAVSVVRREMIIAWKQNQAAAADLPDQQALARWAETLRSSSE